MGRTGAHAAPPCPHPCHIKQPGCTAPPLGVARTEAVGFRQRCDQAPTPKQVKGGMLQVSASPAFTQVAPGKAALTQASRVGSLRPVAVCPACAHSERPQPQISAPPSHPPPPRPAGSGLAARRGADLSRPLVPALCGRRVVALHPLRRCAACVGGGAAQELGLPSRGPQLLRRPQTPSVPHARRAASQPARPAGCGL